MNEEVLQLISQYLLQFYPEITKNIPIKFNENLLTGHQLKEQIENGNWDSILNRLDVYGHERIPNKKIAIQKFKIIEQKIHERLANGDQTEALNILRSELSPMSIFPEKIYQLAQNILKSDAKPKDRVTFAEELFHELKSVPGLIIAENRLEEIVEQAKEYQRIKCPFHYNRKMELSIWHDHKCPITDTIILRAEDVNMKRIEKCEDDKNDLISLLTFQDYSRLMVIDSDYLMKIYSRNDKGEWTRKAEQLNTKVCDPQSIWPKILKKTTIETVSNSDHDDINQKTILFFMTKELSDTISIAILPGTEYDYAVKSTKDQFTVYYNLKSGEILHSWIRLRCSHILTPFDQSENYFLAVNDNCNILQISTETFEVLKSIPAIDEKLQISSAYLDGERLLVGYNNSTIYYYDDWKNVGHPCRIFRGHKCTKYRINSILSRFDPNILISCSENGIIYVWNLESGRLIYEIKVHTEGKCVNDVIEMGPRSFISCADRNELIEWTLPD